MKRSRARRKPSYAIVDPWVIPDKTNFSDITQDLTQDSRVSKTYEGRFHTGGFVSTREVSLEYMTRLRGGPLEACCNDAPRCIHFGGFM